MKNRRISIALVLCIVLSVFLGGCSEDNSHQKSMYDDDKKIAAAEDSFSFLVREGNTTQEETKISFKSFDGTETIWYIEAKEDSIVQIKYESEISSGRFKTVLIAPDNKVINIFEKTKESEGKSQGQVERKVQKGESRIKIVGNGAKGKLTLNIKPGSNVEVKTE